MVSSSHEAMHRIFQEQPGLFARTFERLGIPIPDPVEVSLLSTDLTEMKPLERRLDTLLQVDTASGGSYLLAVESQGKKDPDKPGSWAYYASYLYAKYKKPPLLLVVCQDESTARWAETPFHIGMPYWRTLTLHPLVLGPHNVKPITDPAIAAEDIPAAVFAAITHGNNPQADTMLKALFAALEATDLETAHLFAEIIELGLDNTPAAEIWKVLMAVPTSFFRSETSEKLRDEGAVRRAVADTLGVLEVRNIEVTEAVRERITTCKDLDALSRWLRSAVTAERAEDLFAED